MNHNTITFKRTEVKSVELNRKASKLCNELLPEAQKHPVHGEMQRLILLCWANEISDNSLIKRAGKWWLWARELPIKNAFSKNEQNLMIEAAVQATLPGESINFVTSRSPELLHAQVPNQGDPSLPRTRKSLGKFSEIVSMSSSFLPTKASLVFADLAVDNIDTISTFCDIPDTITKNVESVTNMALKVGLPQLEVTQASVLPLNGGFVGDFVDISGTPKRKMELGEKGEELVNTVTRESLLSQERMFGWNKEQSRNHNRNLGVTMGLIGRAIKQINPRAILIHNEAFISRGALNNLFTNPKDPLIVVCLKDLLDSKQPAKERV